VWNLKNKTNEQTKKTLKYKELVVARGDVGGGMGEIDKLPVME